MRKRQSKMQTKKSNGHQQGFSLPEIMVSISIVGTLASIGVPSYINQKMRSCQGYPEQIINQAITYSQAYNDEFRGPAEGWNDLNKIGTIMAMAGTASGNSFSWINLPACDYQLSGERKGTTYKFNAAQNNAFEEQPDSGDRKINPSKNKYNVVGCINVATGASQILSGSGDKSVSTSDLNCEQS